MYLAFTEAFSEDQTFYLSSRLCPDHKSDVIRAVRSRLHDGLSCYLLSTQCIEAGVDFDFPAGAREYASLTAIAQTAGRINRNGTRENGSLLVFRSNKNGNYDFPSDTYHNEANLTYHMAAERKEHSLNTNSLDDIKEYYRKLYSGDSVHGRDKRSIIEAEENCDLQRMAEVYHLIEDCNQCNVIVPYEKGMDEFVALSEYLVKNHYTLTKKELYAHHGITVSIMVNRKSLAYIQAHCHQLCLHGPGQAAPVNWYIADMDKIYDSKTGLKTREEKEGGILDV